MSIRKLKHQEHYDDVNVAEEIALECGDDGTVIVPRSLLVPHVAALKAEVANTSLPSTRINTMVSSESMLLIAQWLEHYNKVDYVPPPRPVTQDMKDVYPGDFDTKFLKDELMPKGPDDIQTLLAVMRAAHALQIEALVDYCCVVAAVSLRGKSDEQTAEMLSIEDSDFGNPAETARAQQTYSWIGKLAE
eukprot:PhM_4_TR1945/c0_g1_i1/m.26433/K03094/SKP1, CBF3D; S-phase kinase-associated protein 1